MQKAALCNQKAGLKSPWRTDKIRVTFSVPPRAQLHTPDPNARCLMRFIIEIQSNRSVLAPTTVTW